MKYDLIRTETIVTTGAKIPKALLRLDFAKVPRNPFDDGKPRVDAHQPGAVKPGLIGRFTSMETELGWKDGIIAVLNAANAPMHYVEIAEQIYERGLRTEQTATPAATVAATIALSFKNDGEHSPFLRVGRGVYALRSIQKDAPVIAQEELAPAESSDVTGLVNAFGMFWDRAKVNWETEPRVLGQQQAAGAKPVNFCEQRGVYL